MAVEERMTYIIMSTKLGTAKLYFKNEDLGKMLKLKDKDNLMVTDVQVDNVEGKLTITITTPMDNITNDRVRIPDGTARKRLSPKVFEDNTCDYSNLNMAELYDECSKRKIEFTQDEINKFFNKRLDFSSGYDTLRMFLERKLQETELNDENEKYDLKIFEFLNCNEFKLAINTECSIKKSYWIEKQENRLQEFVRDTLSENDINILKEDGFQGVVLIDMKLVIPIYVDREGFIFMSERIDVINNFNEWYRNKYNDDNFNK